jgi:hypothetical protein
LKLNVQKFRKATPLFRRRGAGGEVNAMPRPENYLRLSSLDLYPPAPFSSGEGEKILLTKIFATHK